MALSLVLDLVGGEVFQLFTGSVTKALERKAAFRDLLQDIKHTLTSLRRQAAVIQQIRQYNVDLSLSNNDIIDIATQMTKGTELIDRLSGIKFHLWNFCCTNDCAEQLKELNRILEGLFDTLQLQQVRDAKETLKLARQNRDDLQKLKAMLEEILQKIDNPELKGLLKRLGDQNSGDARDASTSSSSSNSNSASGGNTEDEGNGLAQEALVEAALGLLIDAVIEVKESTKMFRPLFKRLESTLDCLRPFIEEMAQDKKLLDRPKEELENLNIQMENGVELVRKCLSVYRWSSNKKDRYTNQVVELDECLQGHLSILKMEVARNVSETSGLIRNIQEVVNRIRGSDFQGSCDIVEPPIPPVKLKMKETLVSEVNITEGSGAVHNLLESKGSYCDVVGPSTPGFEEFLKRRKDYTKETLQRGSVLFPKRPGQPLCLFYMRTGDCKFGLSCRYHHPDCVSSPTGLTLRPETMPNLSELSVVSPLTVGLNMHLKELKRKFLYNRESSILVLSGPAGCGKTRLAKAFCQDDEVKDKFRDNTFFVTVSKKPSIDLIALQILCQLKDYEVPEVENQVTAVEWLGQFLKEAGQYPLLLVLDDVWQASEFHDKCNELKIPNVKILATSRSQLHGFGSPYYINALSDEEAMALIRRSAFLEDGCSYVPEDILRKTVTYCKGLPLALQAIGRSLCEKSTAIWQSRIEELSKGSSISSCESDLLPSLKLSYDALAENPILKECFLDLSLFPECQRVPVDALIDMWGELYGVDENIPIKNLHELTTRGLAKLVGTRKEKVEVDGYYSTLHFTMHDIIRDLVTHLTSQKPIEQRSRLTIETLDGKLPHQIIRIREQKSQPMKARLVLISTDELFSQNWHNMELPDAEVLVLNFQTENYALPEFVQNMIKLKVLIVTSSGTLPAFWPVGFLPAQLSNFQLLSPLPNLRTIRLERISISSLGMHSIQLKCLQKMSLFKCRIGQTFSNPSIQISDTFPNLVETKIDHCNDLVELPAICDLVNLRKLSLIHCHYLITLPQKIGKLAKLEVFRLKSCTVLEMLPGSIMNLNKLAFLDLSNCVSLKELPERIGELRNLKTLNMRGCSSLQKLPLSVLDHKQLQIVVCDEERQKLWKPLLPRLKNLRLKLRFRELQF